MADSPINDYDAHVTMWRRALADEIGDMIPPPRPFRASDYVVFKQVDGRVDFVRVR